MVTMGISPFLQLAPGVDKLESVDNVIFCENSYNAFRFQTKKKFGTLKYHFCACCRYFMTYRVQSPSLLEQVDN